jgi:squalene cyclase
MFANIRLKEDPVKLFWKKANTWRKLFILRCLNAFETDVAKKYLKEMVKLQNVDGGFSKEHGETSSVSFTAEAIMNLTQSGEKPNSQILKKAAAFLWSIQRENGSWSENPKISKEKIPFWSSIEKGVPILTADAIEALFDAGYMKDERFKKAVNWLKQMQSPSGMWINLEGEDPTHVDPDSTQRAISALIKTGEPANSASIQKACEALKNFILVEAENWAKEWPVWAWIAPLDGLIAAGYTINDDVVKYALTKILEKQQNDGSWPDNYEIRVVPSLIKLGEIKRKEALESITISEK